MTLQAEDFLETLRRFNNKQPEWYFTANAIAREMGTDKKTGGGRVVEAHFQRYCTEGVIEKVLVSSLEPEREDYQGTTRRIGYRIVSF